MVYQQNSMDINHNDHVGKDLIATRKEKKTEEFFQHYMLGKLIGDGNFSSVRMCVAKRSLEKFAVKCVYLKDNDVETPVAKVIRREVDIMMRLNHKNILRCIDAFFDCDEILMVLEYAEHGDLYEMIAECNYMPEPSAKQIAREILQGVEYLHSKSIVHRDIKPENFLIFYDSWGDISVKLCDFGLAVEVNEPITEVCGSPSYVAPDILRLKPYGLPVDLWSCGVVIYVVLVQFPPFKGEDNKELFSVILKGKYDFPEPYWDEISANAKDLIRRLLDTNAEKRLKAKDALDHPWLQAKRRVSSSLKKSPHRVTLRVAALAVRSCTRFRHNLEAPKREIASVSSKLVKETLQNPS